jgi:hypothetical protein
MWMLDVVREHEQLRFRYRLAGTKEVGGSTTCTRA